MFDDIPQKRRRREDIERLAEKILRKLNPEDHWAPEILTLLEKASLLEVARGLQFSFVPDQEMEGEEARAESNPPRICVQIPRS